MPNIPKASFYINTMDNRTQLSVEEFSGEP